MLAGDPPEVGIPIEERPLDQPREVAVGREVIEVGADEVAEAGAEVPLAAEGREEARPQAGERPLEDRGVEALLGAEVVADEGRVDPGLAGDRPHRCAVEADLGEDPRAGGEEGSRRPVAALLPAVAASGVARVRHRPRFDTRRAPLASARAGARMVESAHDDARSDPLRGRRPHRRVRR